MIADTEIRIDDEFASLVPPLTDEELRQLEANLLADGCREPLVVWGPEGILLDGHNRYRICREHDIQFDVREVFLSSRDAATCWIIKNQFGRRNLTPYQRAELALKLKEIIDRTAEAIVRSRQAEFTADASDKEAWKPIEGFDRFSVSNLGRVAAGTRIVKQTKTRLGYLSVSLRHGEKRRSFLVHRLVATAFIPNPQNKPSVNHLNGNRKDNCWRNLEWSTPRENARHQKAEYKRAEMEAVRRRLHVKDDTLEKAEFLGKHADEAIKQRLRSGEISINAAIKEVRRQEKRAAVTTGPSPAPTGKHRVIYADPPWQYGNAGLTEYGHAESHYPTMPLADLCAMPVAEWAEDDAVLFLWATSPMLEDAFNVIRAWGFAYKTSFVWDKVKHNFGHYNSVRHEFLLVATRGSCTPDTPKLFDSVQVIERTDRHSEKPEEFRGIIQTLYTHGEKLELFARSEHAGWKVHGNQL